MAMNNSSTNVFDSQGALKSFYEEFAKIKNEIVDCGYMRPFDTLKATIGGRPLVLYGAGRLTKFIMEYCHERDLAVTRICDKSVTGIFNDNIPIIDPQTLKRDYPDATVIVCSLSYNKAICSDLEQLGFRTDQIIPYPFKNASIESMRNIDNYAQVYDLFEDDLSKRLVLDRLRYSFLGTELSPNTQCDMYYEGGHIVFGKNEVYVDGGLSEGSTVEKFIKAVKTHGGGVFSYICF